MYKYIPLLVRFRHMLTLLHSNLLPVDLIKIRHLKEIHLVHKVALQMKKTLIL